MSNHGLTPESNITTISSLHKNIILALNRNWQAINTTTPALAFAQMATGVATALDIEGHEAMTPTIWDDWQALPVRDTDNPIGTVHGPVRVPTIIVLARYNRVPLKRPKFNPRAIRDRDGGRCQYTGHPLSIDEGNIDYVMPRSRGGLTSWENCVLAAKDVNTRKAERTPKEAGLLRRSAPTEPRMVPMTALLRNTHQIPA